MTNYTNIKKCPKCREPGGLMKCPKCHLGNLGDKITIIYDHSEAWKVWEESRAMTVIVHQCQVCEGKGGAFYEHPSTLSPWIDCGICAGTGEVVTLSEAVWRGVVEALQAIRPVISGVRSERLTLAALNDVLERIDLALPGEQPYPKG